VDKFAILIYREGDKDRLTVLSPYLQKVFRSVVRYFPEVIIDSKTLSFAEPYAPLYFYLDDMIQYVQNDKDEEARPQDMDVLMYFYNRWVAEHHAKVRQTLAQGTAIFEYLWALYKPGECIYELDEFEQPRLYVIETSTFRSGAKDLGSDLGNLFPILPNINTAAGRFVVDVWHTTFDSPTQKFTRLLKTMVIKSFSGTRAVTSLEFYPFKYYMDGSKMAADSLLSDLEHRGYRWKDLIGESSSCLYHDGPAQELKQGLMKTIKQEKSHVRIHPLSAMKSVEAGLINACHS
jgi:hypothetical protein